MSSLTRSRFRTAAIAVCVAAASVSATGTGGAAGGQCRSIEGVAGGWTAGPLPATPSLPAMGSTPVVATSVVGQNPSVTVATDGVSVFRTTDGGCTWQTVFNVGASDYYSASGLVAGYSITNIATAPDSGPVDKQNVYLALSPNPMNAFTMVTLFGAALPELFAASHDGGRTFSIVPPTPTASGPLPVECVFAPTVFFVPPHAGKTIYVQCAGGLAQAVAEQVATGAQGVAFRSNDGGASWTMLGLPTADYTPGWRWLAPGTQKNELWATGFWTPLNSSQHYLVAWRSHDGGATWSMSRVEPKPQLSTIPAPGVAVDMAPGRGYGTVVVYGLQGIYVSSDLGKHWSRLRPVAFASGSRPPVSAFYLGHSLYVLFAGQIQCKGQPMLVRYPHPTSRPVTVTFPSKWGQYAGWAPDSTDVAASGLARFCDRTGAVTTAKLLNLRIH